MSNHTDIEDLREALVGRSVTSVQLGGDLPHKPYEITEGKLTLDDGTVLLMGGNEGGCSCGAGDYELVRLNEMPINGIMNVEITDEADEYGERHTYRIFVLAEDRRFVLAEFQGDDGNGWYGTGFWFTVQAPTPS